VSLISKRKDSVAVVGIGTTRWGAMPEHDATSLGIWALRNAAEDAGIRLEDIDGLICQRLTDYQKFVQITNMSPKLVTATPGAGRMTGGTIQMAVQAILSGMLDTVAVVYGNDGRSAGARYGGKGDSYGTGADQMWHPYGMTSPGAVHSMLFQRHAHQYGTKVEQLGLVATAFRKHAMLNPEAVMRKPMTMDDYLNSRFICEPLRLLDYCLVNDGAACVIVTTAERARDLRKPPVYISGMQPLPGGAEEFIWAYPGMGVAQQSVFEYDAGVQPVYRMAGVTHKDIDALFTYDAFSILPWIALERFGFCKPGEAPAFTQGGRIELGGELPMNTNGGLLSEGHILGWGHQVEIVRQLRGECCVRQIAGAEVIQWANCYGDSMIYRK